MASFNFLGLTLPLATRRKTDVLDVRNRLFQTLSNKWIVVCSSFSPSYARQRNYNELSSTNDQNSIIEYSLLLSIRTSNGAWTFLSWYHHRACRGAE